MLLLLIGLVIVAAVLSSMINGILDLGQLLHWPRLLWSILGIAFLAWLVGDD